MSNFSIPNARHNLTDQPADPFWYRFFESLMNRAKSNELESFTVANLPSPGITRMIFVSDESGGAVPAFSDGTNWRRVTDRAIVS